MYEANEYDISSSSTEYLEELYKSNVERFKKLNKSWLQTNNRYSDDVWKMINTDIHESVNINFILSDFLSQKDLSMELIESLKSFAILHLEQNYSITVIAFKISSIIDAVEKSSLFDPNFLAEFNSNYFLEDYSSSTINKKAAVIIEFFDYSSVSLNDEYLKLVTLQYNSSLNSKDLSRIIPSSHDILKFALIVEDFFKNHIDLSYYLRYYPIYLWWNLTNIIPLRISEFCLIKRDCLTNTKEGYLLELPRMKERMKRDIRYDQIIISNELAYSILEYQEKTKNFGESKTLINYISTRYDVKKNKYKKLKAYNNDCFLKDNFEKILESFYNEVVQKIYGFEILEDNLDLVNKENNKYLSRKIRPNDTRHFAFLNLMLQGYHPSEIARLGGHKNVYSQYAYHNHLEYWADSDLTNLLITQQSKLSNMSNNFFYQIIFKNKIEKAILDKDDFQIPLRIGYCVDPNQNCMVDQHYLCVHWRITKNDYQEHFEELQTIIQEQKSNFKILINKLLDLYKSGIFEGKELLYSSENSKYNYRLVESAKEVKQALFQLSKLKDKVHLYEK